MNINVVIEYRNESVLKDFKIFIKGLNLLKYPVKFIVVGEFPEDIKNEFKFIKSWYWCKAEDIPEMKKQIKL
jgi:hypothetical protein